MNCLLLLSVIGFATSLASAQDVPVEKYKLDNGLTVILREDHSLPVVSVNIWYHVGSKDEAPHRSGFAHLFEHLMFMGTQRAPKGQFDEIMEAGGGSNNASTNEDRTDFYDTGPSSMLPTLLWLEADRMETLGQNIDQKKLDLQREIVKNERRETVENEPYGRAQAAIPEIMFPEGHPYHVWTIGHMEDIDAATLKDVKDFFSTFYVPNNASMVVAGDFSAKEVKPLIQKLFGTLARRDDPIHRSSEPIHFEGLHRITMVDKVQVPKLYMVWHSAPAFSKGDINMELAASILADGVASRLYQQLVADGDYASDVNAYQDSKMLGSLFYIELTPKTDVSLEDLEFAADKAIAEFVKDGPKPEELQRQASKLEYGTLSSLQSLESVADRLNEYEYFLGEPNSFRKVLDKFRSASAKDVQDEARATLHFDSRLILRVIPEKVTPQASPRDVRPGNAPEKDFSLSKPSQFRLSNGIAVSYWQRPELPIMALSAVLPHGAALDAQAKAGLTNSMSDMLEQGGTGIDAATFESELALLGARFDASADRRGFTIGLTSLASGFEKAVALYSRAMIHPRFDAMDWRRIQRSEVNNLKEDLSNPDIVARRVASTALFGPIHPYGAPIAGTAASVSGLTLDDIKAAYLRAVRPDDMTIFAGGSLDAAQVQTILEKALGDWKTATGPVIDVKPLTFKDSEGGSELPKAVYIVEKPDSPQTVIRLVAPAPNVTDPRRLTLEAMYTVLGGTFTSRLNRILREEKGYTYDAGASYYNDTRAGTFAASSDVRSDVTGFAIQELLSQVKKFRTGDATNAEVVKARLSLRTGMISAMGGASGLVSMAVTTFLDGRPFSSIADDLTALNKLDVASVNSVTRLGLQLSESILVLVGDKTLILKELQGLGLPTPTIVTPLP